MTTVRGKLLELLVQRSIWVAHLYDGFDVLGEAERAGDADGVAAMLEELDEFVHGLRELEDDIAKLQKLADLDGTIHA